MGFCSVIAQLWSAPLRSSPRLNRLLLTLFVIKRDTLPEWITDEEGQRSQKLMWEVIAKELEAVEPGCVKKMLE